MNPRTLIIGSGLAGITLVRELRKLDKEREIIVITADDGGFYSKPNLSNAFAANKRPEDMVLTPADKLERDLGILIMANAAVARIDAGRREVVCTQGTLAYDQLVLAVGAAQIPLPLAGDGVPDAISINSLADYARLRSRLAGKRSVAIVGAGLIGCEFANDLRLGDFAVDVYDQIEQPMGRLLPPVAAQQLRDKLAAIGVGFHLGARLEAIRRDGERYVLIDSHGNARPYDLVLSAIGLRPNLALAKTAGLATALGIVTDAFLRTSDPNIYALGDCVELGGLFLPYVMPIMLGAKKLAGTLTGKPEPVSYPAMPIVLKTPACPTVVSPPPSPVGHWDATVSEDGLRALFVDQASGQPSGFVVQGGFTRERMALAAAMPNLSA
ncbi:MAG: FAD-dependent oxidoreductase [Gammaproteobacteria bacterium]|nr:FAD-dependent oxidoreductase [Gammaproteobacteria bacterium]MBU1602360.1 FAD-dependent oxidoreductase [Gammaproteobacteria bacterium]MBU2433166.1 FAD-dependent oxidoreductase [Gammaproteobacteria bacterium]MBU2451081.1 FAD-dependent oxidoreductase [Gammaproteobacteria bacterium]